MTAKRFLITNIGKLDVDLHYDFSTSNNGKPKFMKCGEIGSYTLFSINTGIAHLLYDAILRSECCIEVEYSSGKLKSLEVIDIKSVHGIELICNALKIIDGLFKQTN